ncbi:MAG: hypothetical protein IJG62_00365 [Synergistaceae bacterium]|nr:hypothetical protein [Synergistaceae bacterium]MBQ3626093.1 hypothetical protein [Synergistaceae bacterium]
MLKALLIILLNYLNLNLNLNSPRLVTSADIARVREIKRERVLKINKLLNMTLESLSYDVDLDIARARGAGIIKTNSSRAKAAAAEMQARRAALSSARRGLLMLKSKINNNNSKIILSGYVPPLKILAEFTSGDLYFVDVETSLRKLLIN